MHLSSIVTCSSITPGEHQAAAQLGLSGIRAAHPKCAAAIANCRSRTTRYCKSLLLLLQDFLWVFAQSSMRLLLAGLGAVLQALTSLLQEPVLVEQQTHAPTVPALQPLCMSTAHTTAHEASGESAPQLATAGRHQRACTCAPVQLRRCKDG
jgi:hypothetical protein